MDNILEVSGLTKNYGSFQLKDINFSLPKGTIMGLVGANGAGKTTTIKLILNLIKRDSGTIRVFDQDNIQNEKEIKEQLGVVFDESYFHDNLSAKDINKVMGNIYKNWSKDAFYSYLKKFELQDSKLLKQFSRGMKMKLSIAVALSHNPKLLILDEPTSGLDPILRNEILDIFLDFIQEEDRSIIFSSHITSDLEKIADYITFIDNGEIILTGGKDELLGECGIVKCGNGDFERISRDDIMGYRQNRFGYEVLVKNRNKVKRYYPEVVVDNASIEEMLLLMKRGA